MTTEKQHIVFLADKDIKEFGEYLAEKENSVSTIQKYQTDIRTFSKFLGDDRAVDKKRVLEYKEWLCAGYATSSVNSMLTALNQFFDFMGAAKLKVKNVKVQRQFFLAEEKEMTKEEYRRLINAALAKKKMQLALAMETLAGTGARVSELQYFTVERIKKGIIEISNKGKYRKIILPGILQKKLLIYAGKQKIEKGCIFITKSGKVRDRSNLWRQMKALEKETGIEWKKIFPHNFRHLFARLYYIKTRDLTGLADILGHSNLDVTRIYTANSGELYKKQMESQDLISEVYGI